MNSKNQTSTLARWYRNDSDFVHRDEAICEIETSEANADVVAPNDGYLRQLAKVGDVIRGGKDVAKLDPVQRRDL